MATFIVETLRPAGTIPLNYSYFRALQRISSFQRHIFAFITEGLRFKDVFVLPQIYAICISFTHSFSCFACHVS